MLPFLLESDDGAIFKIVVFAIVGLFWLIGQIASRMKKTPEADLPPPAPIPPPVSIPPLPTGQQRPPKKKPRRPLAEDVSAVGARLQGMGRSQFDTLPPVKSDPLGGSLGHSEPPMSPVTSGESAPSRGQGLRRAMTRTTLQQQLVLTEILGKPLSLREPS